MRYHARRMVRILVTNDDGIYSEGLRKLADACLRIDGVDVTIVAPDREQSAASHALTLNRPLRMLKLRDNEYIVDGTPADCVNLAVLKLMRDDRPALVVSGSPSASSSRSAGVATDALYAATTIPSRKSHL